MEKIKSNELIDADILLYHGSSIISRAIRYFDGTDYNHAALYMGNNTVLEAIAEGVVRRDTATSINNSQPVIVMRLNNRPHDMAPVITRAEQYEGNRYAYEQILLLVLICTSRRIRPNNAVARFVTKILENATALLLQLTAGNKKALICSELVYRSYDEAMSGYSDPYSINIDRNYLPEKMLSHSLVNNESLISMFYGVNNTYFNISLSPSPYLKTKNIPKTITTIANDAELEILFNDVQKSYRQEEYGISSKEAEKLKSGMDTFITLYTNTFASEKNGNIIDIFLRENSNFVTPGDLFKAKNLIIVGKLK